MTRMADQKEVRVSCDFETNTALVRIFKFRNYTWSGGRVYELKRDCDRLKELGNLILKYQYKNGTDLLNSEIIWNDKAEIAISYKLDMSKKEKL
jgi:hypothetical protein